MFRSVFLSLFLISDPLLADTFNWSGAAFFDDDFSNPENWFEGDVPVIGDVCRFERSGGTMHYDISPAPRYGAVRFTGPFEVTGGRLNAGALEVSGRTGVGDGFGNVTLFGGARTTGLPARIELNHGGTLRIHGLVADAETRIIAHKDNVLRNTAFPIAGPASAIVIQDGISGAGAIFIESQRAPTFEIPDSHVSFTGANTSTGPLTVGANGTLRIFNSASLGGTVSGTTIRGSLEIEMSNPRTIAEPLTLSGRIKTFVSGGGAGGQLTLTGPIDCRSGAIVTATPVRIESTLSGGFTGSDLSFRLATFDSDPSDSLVTLAGTQANTLIGTVETECDLVLAKPSGTPAVPRRLRIVRGTTTWAANNQLDDTATLEFDGGSGVADISDHSETLAEINFRTIGTVRTGTLGNLRVSARILPPDGCLVVSGVARCARIEGNFQVGGNPLLIPRGELDLAATTTAGIAGGSISFSGPGTLHLNGVCSVPVSVKNGTLEANSMSPGMAVTLDQTSSGDVSILAGTGTAGPVTAASGGGVVSPGGEDPGGLRCGNLSLNDKSAFRADIDGTTPGTGFDQLTVTGTVALGNAELTVGNTLFLPVGSSFTILQNDGTDPIVGTFAGLPQGATIGGFVISYTGGSGNDVTLTFVSLGTGTTRTWTGLGSDANWLTAANWSPTGSPQNGDSLVFPSGASRRTNFNNIANLGVRSISITGGPYQISGNAIALAEGITVSGPVLLNHSISTPISLIGSQTFAIGPHFLSLGGGIDTNGMALTFQTQGTPGTSVITCGGVISEGAADQFAKTGNGVLSLTNANTTRGNFHVRQGVLRVTNSASLGSRLGVTIVDEGAQLLVAGTDLALNETILLAGTLNIGDNAGAPGFGDPIDCAPTARLFVSATGVTQCNVFDELRGTALTKTGPGTLNLTGAKTKSLSDGITIDEGRAIVTGTAGTILLPGNTTVGVDPARAAVLEIRQRRVTEEDSQLIVNESGSVLCDSPEIAFAGLTLRGGTVSTDGNGMSLNGPLTTLPSAQTAVLSGRITLPQGSNGWTVADGPAAIDLQVDAVLRDEVSADAILSRSGAGSTVFTGANSILSVTIQSGENTWNSLSNITGLLVTGGTLSGSGRAARLSIRDDARFAPGNSAGLFTSGALDMELGGTLHLELNGATPGSGHDQIRCTDDPSEVILSDARLSLSQGFSPVPGTVLTIVDVQGVGDPGPFLNYPEGATVLAGAQRYRISYFGGNGNDITLTALSPLPVTPLAVTNFDVAEDSPSPGRRTVSGVISGGPGAAGLGIEVEFSDDLRNWDPFPLRVADENGNLTFTHTFRADKTPVLFYRGRVP